MPHPQQTSQVRRLRRFPGGWVVAGGVGVCGKKQPVTPYYEDAAVTIYHGDCRDVLCDLKDAQSVVDYVFTSPPYNRGDMSGGLANLAGGYRSYDDQMPQWEYEEWQRDVLYQCWGMLTERGAIYYNHKPRIVNGEAWLPLCLNPGLPLRQIVTWDTVTGINWSESFYLPLTEWVLIFAKPAFRLLSKQASHASDLWRIKREMFQSGRPDHPAAFPLGLPQTALSSVPSGLVLDPFMGSGTTLRAAKNTGHRAIGIEIDERYCEAAAKRMAQGTIWEAA